MSESTPLRQVQLAELEIAKKFVRFCEEHDLRYYLFAGTFLGAVRHKGYIPWDDDTDFCMPREDFDRFIALCQERPCDFKLSTYKNSIDNSFYHLFIRIQEPSSKIKLCSHTWWYKTTSPMVDVFPLDGLPRNRVYRSIWKYYLLWRRATVRYAVFSECLSLDRPGRPLAERLLIKIGKVLPVEKLFHVEKELEKLERAAKRFSNAGAKYLINIDGAYKLREIFPKEVFGEGKLYQFEGSSMRGPSDYDAYLTQMYGDYMTPPPEESPERNHHSLAKIEIEN